MADADWDHDITIIENDNDDVFVQMTKTVATAMTKSLGPEKPISANRELVEDKVFALNEGSSGVSKIRDKSTRMEVVGSVRNGDVRGRTGRLRQEDRLSAAKTSIGAMEFDIPRGAAQRAVKSESKNANVRMLAKRGASMEMLGKQAFNG